jgi:hypothetical protein
LKRPFQDRYQNLNFEVFDTYEKRRMSDDYIQDSLDGIRDEIDQYAGFVRGMDMETSVEVREPLRVLDDVKPLIDLRKIQDETVEVFSLPKSRLVMVFRSMFGVQTNTRLE